MGPSGREKWNGLCTRPGRSLERVAAHSVTRGEILREIDNYRHAGDAGGIGSLALYVGMSSGASWRMGDQLGYGCSRRKCCTLGFYCWNADINCLTEQSRCADLPILSPCGAGCGAGAVDLRHADCRGRGRRRDPCCHRHRGCLSRCPDHNRHPPCAAHATPRQRRPAGVVVARSPRPARPGRARQRAREYREAATPLFRTAADGSTVPDVRAEAAIIYNPVTQRCCGGERAGLALDCQHHQGDDRARVPRRQPPTSRSRSPSSAATSRASTTYLRANDKLTAERSAAPAAHRVRQRRGPRARARVAVRLRRVHRADEREGRGARPREHALRRSVRACSRRTCRRPTTWRG